MTFYVCTRCNSPNYTLAMSNDSEGMGNEEVLPNIHATSLHLSGYRQKNHENISTSGFRAENRTPDFPNRKKE